MDDFNVNSLIESKNEWSSRLLNILTPTLIEGIKSVFEEAFDICKTNESEEKYLMTFQNLLNKKFKQNIIINFSFLKYFLYTSIIIKNWYLFISSSKCLSI